MHAPWIDRGLCRQLYLSLVCGSSCWSCTPTCCPTLDTDPRQSACWKNLVSSASSRLSMSGDTHTSIINSSLVIETCKKVSSAWEKVSPPHPPPPPGGTPSWIRFEVARNGGHEPRGAAGSAGSLSLADHSFLENLLSLEIQPERCSKGMGTKTRREGGGRGAPSDATLFPIKSLAELFSCSGVALVWLASNPPLL